MTEFTTAQTRRERRAAQRQQIADQCTVKVGDKVILSHHRRSPDGKEVLIPRSIVTITKVTKTRLVYGPRPHDWLGRGPIYSPATPEELEAAQRYFADQRAKGEAAERERLERESTPLYKLTSKISSFNCGDREPWEKIPMERLEQIAKWIEEANP